MDDKDPPKLESKEEEKEEGVPLIEGWMLGALLFPEAMAKVVEAPPANDPEPDAKG